MYAQSLEEDIPEIESVLRIASWKTFPIRYENKAFTEPSLLLVDSNFFRFFNFRMVEGHPDSVLTGERKVVVTESAAKRYFNYKGKGDRTPIGKKINLAQGYAATVVGIAEDPPLNSHFHFSVILSLESFTSTQPGDYMTGTVFTYFKLKSGATLKDAFVRINNILEYKIGAQLEEEHNTTLANFKAQGNDIAFFTQPLLDIHLKSQLGDEFEPNSDVQYLFTFGSIALFITVLACINFMNLSTARSASRAKEVGIRKAVGAPYNRLMTQFLLESYLYILIAVVISLFFILVLLPVFNLFTGKQLSFVGTRQPGVLGICYWMRCPLREFLQEVTLRFTCHTLVLWKFLKENYGNNFVAMVSETACCFSILHFFCTHYLNAGGILADPVYPASQYRIRQRQYY